MLEVLADRLKEHAACLLRSFQRADATDLPFRDYCFDMIVVVHVFHFVREWKRTVGELLRVLRDEGVLVLMHTGMGMKIPFVNDGYRAYCDAHGFPIDTLGVGSTQEVSSYLKEFGYAIDEVRNRWQWTSHIRLDEAISYVRNRSYSFTTTAPDGLHSDAVRCVEAEASERFDSLTTEVSVPNQVYLVIVRKPFTQE